MICIGIGMIKLIYFLWIEWILRETKNNRNKQKKKENTNKHNTKYDSDDTVPSNVCGFNDNGNFKVRLLIVAMYLVM